jgi:hypothetical protein
MPWPKPGHPNSEKCLILVATSAGLAPHSKLNGLSDKMLQPVSNEFCFRYEATG